MHAKRWILASLLCLLLALAGAGLVHARSPAAVAGQGKTYYWNRFDVDITVQSNGDLRVVETQEFVFTSGEFHRVYAYIPLDKIERITDVQVTGDGRPYRESRGREDYTFETFVDRDRNEFNIVLYFAYTSDSTHTYVIGYTAQGALRLYEDGDQVWWKAIASERDFPIESATVTVNLPAGVDQIIQATSYGVPAEYEVVGPRTVVYHARDLGPGEELEVRVQFPHGVVQAPVPSWQAEADRQAEYEQTWKPVVNLGLLVVSLFIAIAGLVGTYLLWHTRGRDAPVGLIAEHIPEPPSDLPPGVVGALVDEQADMQDIIASIVDLARRGVIKMTEIEEPGFLGIGTRRDFSFERLDGDQPLRKYEQILLDKLFRGQSLVRLSELKEKFYTAIPTLQKELYQELVRAGFYRRGPNRTRQIYAAVGVIGLILSFGVGFVALIALLPLAELAVCLPLALGLVSAALLVVARFMPQRTRQGATAAAKWRAFKRYLEHIERYTKLEETKEIFDRYLPYAIAFGLEKSWVQKFAAVDAPAPTWYEPMPPVIIGRGHPGRRYRPGMGRSRGPGWGAPAPSRPSEGRREAPGMPDLPVAGHGLPQRGSDELGRGLQGMSDGLATMLNVAGSILASAPRSSGGGGGWSGGGGFGGGGGGGGGRGAG